MADTSSQAMTHTSTAAPSTRELPEGHTELTEGKATILHHGTSVFYNPVQVVNRDMSVAVLRYFVEQRKRELEEGTFKNRKGRLSMAEAKAAHGAEADGGAPAEPDGIRVLEGLAASGLRAIRYAKEVPGIARVDANDLDPAVVDAMRRNVEHNGPEASSRVRPLQGDCRLVMMQNQGGYDAVDLDPYGTPAQFLDTAVQAVSEGGLLMVTATDMAALHAVLCGNNGEACWGKYGSYPLHRSYCHEMALRILLASIESHANRYKRHIVPMISLSIDFYIRVFVRVYTSAAEVKNAGTKLAYVYQSQGCESFYLQRLARKVVKGNSVKFMPGAGPPMPERCPETGSGFLMGGPFWAEPIHDPAWLQGVLAAVKADRQHYQAFDRLQGLLTAAAEELPDVPLYFKAHDLAHTLKTTPPPAQVLRSAIVNAGYRVSSTHANPLGTKTDAPFAVIWDIMRAWVKDHPVKAMDPNSYAGKLLAKEPTLKVNFSRASAAVSRAKAEKVARFLPNPEANWGPMAKHTRTGKARDSADGRRHPDPTENGHGSAASVVESGQQQSASQPIEQPAENGMATTSAEAACEPQPASQPAEQSADHEMALAGS